MHVLFVHQNYPGQFGNLAAALVQRGDRVAVLHYRKELVPYPGIEAFPCDPPASAPTGIHRFLVDFEMQVRVGLTTADRATQLKREGCTPDLIIGHPGWGEMLFLKDVWPAARILSYPEFFNQEGRSDASFEAEFNDDSQETVHHLRLKNTVNLHSFASADRLWCPTEWQRLSLPAEQQGRTVVIHDGVDTAAAVPNPNASVTVTREGTKHVFTAGDEVITFVNRNHEPVRGFHIFIRALPAILERRPKARVILIGGDGLSYSGPPPRGSNWREFMLNEVGSRLDRSRVHFVGKVPKEIFLAVMQLSTVHVYLTHPFVLSWSFLEAMSCGCRILASNTSPVTEFVKDGENGILFNFFRPDELAAKAIEMLHHRGRYERMRHAARETILQRCDLRSICLPAQLRLIDALASAR